MLLTAGWTGWSQGGGGRGQRAQASWGQTSHAVGGEVSSRKGGPKPGHGGRGRYETSTMRSTEGGWETLTQCPLWAAAPNLFKGPDEETEAQR